jgi:transaldolase
VKPGQPLPPDYYVRARFGPHCVNTAPLETIEAFEAGEKPVKTLPFAEEAIEEYFGTLERHGISMEAVYRQLMEEGVSAFEEAFRQMLKQLEG